MANSDKDIKITPNTGESAKPKIEVVGADNATKTLTVNDDGSITFDSTLTVSDLTVSGTTTTLNTETMTVEDKNIVLGSGNGTGEVVDATGITLEGGSGDDITFQYNATDNRMELKHGSSFEDLKAGTITGTFVGNVTGNASGTAATVTGAAQSAITSLGTLTALTGGTGDLIWDTDTLVVDSSENRVGIGTTSPAHLLDVDGDARFGTTGVAGKIYLSADDATSFLSWNSTGTDITLAASDDLTLHADDDIFFQAGGATKMTLLNTGRLGIGTTSPGSLLHLSSSPAAGSVPVEMLRLENIEPAETNDMVAGQGPSMTFYVPEGNQTTQLGGQIAVVRESATDTDAAAAMSFWTAANDASPTEKMRVTSTGKVGIGTTSPDAKLDIEQTDGAVHGLKVYRNDSSTSTSLAFLHDDSIYVDNPTLHVKNDRTDQYGYAAVFEGRVGIGTTVPDQQLHVEGSILADAYNFATTTLASNYTDGATSLVLTNASQFPLKGSGTINGVAFTWTSISGNTLTVPDLDASYTAGVTVVADTGLFFRDGFENVAQPSVTVYDKDNSGASRDDLSINANAGIRFRLGNESQMQLTTDQLSLTTGNQGSAAIFGFRDRTDMGIKSNTSFSVGMLAPDNVYINIDSNNNNSDDTAFIVAKNSNVIGSGTELFRVAENGNVGIGTASPRSLLDVRGAAGSPGHLSLSTAETTVVDGDILGRIDFIAPLEADGVGDSTALAASIYAEADGTFSDTVNTTDIVFATGSSEAATEKMRLLSTGQIELSGTTVGSPDDNTHVRLGFESEVLRIDSNDGYLQIGAQNSTYMHFVTDRGKFYFNRELIVNEGIVSSHDENLRLQRVNTTADQIEIGEYIQAFTVGSTGVMAITNPSGGANPQVTIGGSLTLQERASAPDDNAGYGQLWVKKTGTGQLFFTTDDGTDIQITTASAVNASAGGGAVSAVANGSNNRIATFSSADALNGEANLTFNGSTLALTGDLNVGSGDLFVDDSTGRVGIKAGTTPDTTLHVNGNVLLGSVFDKPTNSTFDAADAQLILGGAFNAEFNTGTDKAHLLISSHDNDDGTALYPIFVQDENVGNSSDALTGADFFIKNRQSSSGDSTAYFGGKVGVGTISPETELHVDGSIAVAYALAHAGQTSQNRLIFGTNTQEFQTGGTSRIDISNSGLRIGTGARVTKIVDEDDMASNSATALATQQSIKAYVDANAGGGGGSSGSAGAKPVVYMDSGNVNVTTTEATIPLDTEVLDPDNNATKGTDGHIRLAAGGLYEISYSIPINDDEPFGGGSPDRTRIFAFVQHDDNDSFSSPTTIAQSRSQVYTREASGGSGLSASFIYEHTANDYIRIRIDQEKGTNISTETNQSQISIRMLSTAAETIVITAEESDDYISSTGAAGNANGFFPSYGNGAHNTTKSSSGSDFGIVIPVDCTLTRIDLTFGNKGSETNSSNQTVTVFKNNAASTTTFTYNASGTGGNAFKKAYTSFSGNGTSYSAGDTFNLRATGLSGYTNTQVGPARMTATFTVS